MSDALYERYKEALRRGHVAALRGRFEEALEAYGEAASIAPERPLPQSSIGGVLLRMGRTDDALAAYTAALALAPRDEAGLAGRADVLARVGRRAEAADTLDLLADMQERAGRLPEACDTARRALELAESKARRRNVGTLAKRLREVPADAAAVDALERALSVLEPVVTPTPGEATVHGSIAAPEPGAVPVPTPDPEPEPAPPPPPDGAAHAAEAEDRLDQGDLPAARERLLAAASAHRDAGSIDAAIDACYLALAIAPADADLHLALAGLYLDRGLRTHAAEKLLLLVRLAGLEEDATVRARICAVAAARLPDEPRLAALCA